MAPVVTLSPTSVASGTTATFSASASGTPSPSVQWDVSSDAGATWSPISGATNDAYSVAATSGNNGYEYEAVFSNASGSATSAAAQLTYLAPSANWSGYIATGGTFSAVSGSWTVPTVHCPVLGSSDAVQWVGIDGNTDTTVEQDGTETSCVGSTPKYSAWYEMFGDNSVNNGNLITLASSLYPVHPGDTINASVTLSDNTWTLSVADATASWSFSIPIASPTPAPNASSAEWIVEAPEVCNRTCTEAALSDFGTVTFTNASATSSTSGPGSITAGTVTALETIGNGGVIMMKPGVLDDTGSSFSVTWYAGS